MPTAPRRAPRPRILVADELGSAGLAILRQAGEVDVRTGLKPRELAAVLPPYHALVVRSATKVDAEALELAANLVVIGRAGIGVDNIDVDAASARGIAVMNSPEAGASTTAELAIALLVALARKIPQADASLRAGKWEKSKFSGVELGGKTLGVLGLGRIGRIVAARGAGLAMRVIAHDPFVRAGGEPAGVTLVDFERLLAESDFLTIHVPLSDATRHLIGAAELAKTKRGARLVHCARGGIVDEAALLAALESGRLAGAALDVFEQEPPPQDHPLLARPDVIVTPHIGASTEEAKHAVALAITRQVAACLKSGLVLNGVNVPLVAPADAEFLTPYLLLAERLARLLAALYPGRPRALRLLAQGEVGERAARPLLVRALVGALHGRDGAVVTQVNAERVARELGVATSAEQSALKQDFVNLVRVEIDGPHGLHHASGTLIGRRHLRLVELDEFLLDAIPEGALLVTHHADRPGVAGRIGTLLGDAGLNIARLQIGLPRERARAALGVFNLDAAPSAELLARLCALDGVEHARCVELGGGTNGGGA
jgi:D-3-phosphoglycerate dehydrogenase/(S)-sulfolactate dehydrogenase